MNTGTLQNVLLAVLGLALVIVAVKMGAKSDAESQRYSKTAQTAVNVFAAVAIAVVGVGLVGWMWVGDEILQLVTSVFK